MDRNLHAGSGTTAVAAVREGFQVILCENDPESQEDIRRRFTGEPAPSDDPGYVMIEDDIPIEVNPE
jgi:DNA modification methylase